MTPKEIVAAMDRIYSDGMKGEVADVLAITPKRVALVAEAIRAAVAEEREACMRDMCPYCLQGEQIVEPAECIAMGHYYNDLIICHPFGHDKEGRVTGHVGCAAAAIRIRGQA